MQKTFQKNRRDCHERQDFWCTAACGKIVYASNRNSASGRSVTWCGGSFTNETMLETYGLMGIMGPGTIFNAILQVMSAAGDIVFTNLPIIFAMGVAIGMAKKEKEVAALSAAIGFFIMHASIGAMISNHGGPEAMLSGATTSVVGI